MKNDDKEIEDDSLNPEYIIGGLLMRRIDNKLKDLVKKVNSYSGRKDFTIDMLRSIIFKMDNVEIFLDKRTEKVRNKKTW